MKSRIQKIVFTGIAMMLFVTATIAQSSKVIPLGVCLENYEYPYPVKYLPLTIQGETLKMAYMDVQPASYNGHNIMLLHGKNFNGAYWRTTIKALTDQGYRVIVPDQIGFGKSSKPNSIQYTFQLLAQNTKAILDTLHITRLSVLGHSMGGMVATRFVLMYPEMIEKFILENPIGLEDWKVKAPYQTVDKWYDGELKQDYDKIKKYQLDNYYFGDWKPEYDEWVNLQAGWTLSPEYNRIAWNAALTYDMIFTQPVCYEFSNITAPTLLIIGQRDRTALAKNTVSEAVRNTMGNYPALGKATQQKIKNSKLVEIPSAGHLPHIQTFQQFIEPLLDFLKS
ncbi:MAG: alpha/beta hydrolase [Chitinophagaceae bacterium]